MTKRRISARLGGISNASPKMSVTKPGVSRSVPPTMISAPSNTSRWGIRPSSIAVLNRLHAPRPSERSSAAPRMLSSSSSAIVGHTPIHPPTWMITYNSTSGTTMKTITSASTWKA